MGQFIGYQADARLNGNTRPPALTHTLFADDLLIISTATPTQGQIIRRIMSHVQECTGLIVNAQKSSVIFSPSVHPQTQRWITRILKIQRSEGSWPYLGIYIQENRAYTNNSKSILQAVDARLQTWRAKSLTLAGRIVLIQSVLQAIPLYSMFAAVVKKSVAEKIDKIARSFLWGGGNKTKPIHLVCWEQVTQPKTMGGLGLRRAPLMRLAVLAYIALQFLIFDHPISHFFRLKYRWEGDPWTVRSTASSSPVWRAFSMGLQAIRQSLIKRSGDPSDIDILAYPWFLPIPFSRIPTMINMDIAILGLQLSDVIKEDQWNEEMLSSLFPPYWKNKILEKTPPPKNSDPPTWSWIGSTAIKPKLSEIYQAMINVTPARNGVKWKTIWKLPVVPKFKTFLWLLLWNKLPTREHLDRIGLTMDRQCPWCLRAIESANHLFLQCHFVEECWRELPADKRPPIEIWYANNWEDRLTHSKWSLVKDEPLKRILFISMLWHQWKARNYLIFRGLQLTARSVVAHALAYAQECFVRLIGNPQGKTLNAFMEQNKRCDGQSPHNSSGLVRGSTREQALILSDGSVDVQSHAAGAGFILILVNTGQVLGAGYNGWPWASPVTAEAEGIRAGLDFANKRGFSDIIVGTDAAQIVKLLSSSAPGPPHLLSLITLAHQVIHSGSRLRIMKVDRCHVRGPKALARYGRRAQCLKQTDLLNDENIRCLLKPYVHDISRDAMKILMESQLYNKVNRLKGLTLHHNPTNASTWQGEQTAAP
ncbi:hypothetical protein QJS10_CPA08g00451 [Acorus calamus]|uniref:Reverse transcriptase domain-containing protein n=1 Tax=Acorus calamus TaxID=4465 RepID=A0AAV9E846_ACOCL|nr:hypothetical protein QJS10_CPA08g00451 [Acorus calamus]